MSEVYNYKDRPLVIRYRTPGGELKVMAMAGLTSGRAATFEGCVKIARQYLNRHDYELVGVEVL